MGYMHRVLDLFELSRLYCCVLAKERQRSAIRHHLVRLHSHFNELVNKFVQHELSACPAE